MNEIGIAAVFKALGDPTRLRILKEIAKNGNNLCVMRIALEMEISQSAVSQHLKTLKNAGLVRAERRGYHVHYSIIQDSLSSFGIETGPFFRSIGADYEDKEKFLEDDCCKHNGRDM